MKHDDYQTFEAGDRVPLLVSLLNHANERGYSSQVSFDYFDAYVFDGEESDFEPVVAVKQVKNNVTKDQLERLVVDSTPTKVVLVEGDTPNMENLLATQPVLAATGGGVYVRGHGWLYQPRRATAASQKDIRLQMAPGWTQREGRWVKKCRSCGKWRGENEYYKRPSTQRTARDPYRERCIPCFKESRNSSR